MKKFRIVLAVDHPGAEDFATWLNNNGHIANVGRDTHNHVDGYDVSMLDDEDEHATIFNTLWETYCK